MVMSTCKIIENKKTPQRFPKKTCERHCSHDMIYVVCTLCINSILILYGLFRICTCAEKTIHHGLFCVICDLCFLVQKDPFIIEKAVDFERNLQTDFDFRVFQALLEDLLDTA